VERRRYLRLLLWIAPLVVLAGYWGYRRIHVWITTRAVRSALSEITGAEVELHRATTHKGRVLFSHLRIKTAAGFGFGCEAAGFDREGWPLLADASGRAEALNCTIEYRDYPPLGVEKINVVRDAEERAGRRLKVLAQTKCSRLNPFLAKAGGVKFERGELDFHCYPRIVGGRLDFPAHVRLRDFAIRSLDGKFEFSAREARAVVRITGSPEKPRLDLGELRPYLGADFVKSFGELAP
jgi:hypothetical protein